VRTNGRGIHSPCCCYTSRRVLQRRNAIGLLDGVEFMISVPVTLIIHRNNRIPARSLPKRPLARSLHAARARALFYRRDVRDIITMLNGQDAEG